MNPKLDRKWSPIANDPGREPQVILLEIEEWHNQINARALIGQSAMGYCARTPKENCASSDRTRVEREEHEKNS